MNRKYLTSKNSSSSNTIISSPDITEKIRKFKALLDDVIITEEDFQEKKKQL